MYKSNFFALSQKLHIDKIFAFSLEFLQPKNRKLSTQGVEFKTSRMRGVTLLCVWASTPSDCE